MGSGPQSWWRAVVTYPPTWAAGLLLAAFTLAFVAYTDPPASMTVAAIVVAALAAAAWPLTMSATGLLAARRFAVDDPDDVDSETMAALASELKALDDSQPFEQLVALGQKRTALRKVLDRRLDPNELTYARYVTTTGEVYRSALHNLHEVAVAHDSAKSIDAGYIERRIAELDRDGTETDATRRERDTLSQRATLRDEQLARISRLLSQNEAALTTLDRTTSALAEVPIGQRPEEVEAAMAALDDLADRARAYAPGDGS